MRTKPSRFVGRGGQKGWPEWVVAGRVVGTGHPRFPQKAGTDRQQNFKTGWDRLSKTFNEGWNGSLERVVGNVQERLKQVIRMGHS
jgi:hypothetical protein